MVRSTRLKYATSMKTAWVPARTGSAIILETRVAMEASNGVSRAAAVTTAATWGPYPWNRLGALTIIE